MTHHAQNTSPARFMTLDDVQHELSISRSQAYALVRSGELRAIQIGGRSQWRVERTELEAYIDRAYAATAQLTDHAGETPLETCQRYAAGELDRKTLIDHLAQFPYVEGGKTDGYDSLIVDPPGTWSEVLQAVHRGLIDESVYDEVFTRRHGSPEPPAQHP